MEQFTLKLITSEAKKRRKLSSYRRQHQQPGCSCKEAEFDAECLVTLNVFRSLVEDTQKVSPPSTAVWFEDKVLFPWAMRADTWMGEGVRTVTETDVGTPGRRDRGVSSR